MNRLKCECGSFLCIVGDISDDKDICPHVVIRCSECKKAYNVFYFRDLAEEQEARAEKAEALSKKLFIEIQNKCKKDNTYYEGYCSVVKNTPECKEETCPIVAKAKEA